MKTTLLPVLLAAMFVTQPARAQDSAAKDPPAEKEPPAASPEKKPEAKVIKGWGAPVDPASDCDIKAENGKLTINVPGSANPHDLSSELTSMTAPRVLQSLKGDFSIQVRVDGEFSPSGESTQQGRTGYTGAGLVVFADEDNFVRIERASLSRGGEERPYTNFEMRVNGALQRIGTTGDFKIDGTQPVWLRLERKGDQMRGAMSQDGKTWTYGDAKELTADAWQKNSVTGGVAAISTSAKSFSPLFAELTVNQGDKADTKEVPKEPK